MKIYQIFILYTYTYNVHIIYIYQMKMYQICYREFQASPSQKKEESPPEGANSGAAQILPMVRGT
jgi:hypothetical protein